LLKTFLFVFLFLG